MPLEAGCPLGPGGPGPAWRLLSLSGGYPGLAEAPGPAWRFLEPAWAPEPVWKAPGPVWRLLGRSGCSWAGLAGVGSTREGILGGKVAQAVSQPHSLVRSNRPSYDAGQIPRTVLSGATTFGWTTTGTCHQARLRGSRSNGVIMRAGSNPRRRVDMV